MRELERAVFVRGHDGQAIGIEIGESIDGRRDAVVIVRDREVAQEGAGGDVWVAFRLNLMLSADKLKHLEIRLTVTIMPFPAREL